MAAPTGVKSAAAVSASGGSASSAASATHFSGGVEVRVHPVVYLGIVDSYERRNEDANRVIGTLLGTSDNLGVEVTNCFCVPHNESEEEVAVDMEFARNMFELHKKVNANEQIVGWYATGHDITEHSVLIHEYYARECKDPIHMTLDTTLRSGRLSAKAYVSNAMGVPNKTQGTMFTPLPLKVDCFEAERVGLSAISKGVTSKKREVGMTSDLEQITNATDTLLSTLDTVIKYVGEVTAGRMPADGNVGRRLMQVVSDFPNLDSSEFQGMLNGNMKDLLMVMYLSQLTTTQLSLADKLNGVAQQERSTSSFL